MYKDLFGGLILRFYKEIAIEITGEYIVENDPVVYIIYKIQVKMCLVLWGFLRILGICRKGRIWDSKGISRFC